ncbi:hypothetical protein [Geobacter sp. DSM 9736]|uniref:hypothetical protein n=1 Tax=Geobacter sp. DSM 9736 TaxID=1277350 RepID=UPI000B5149A4|nr:hypothetical protein [Geobacter sp. DSM 9736]
MITAELLSKYSLPEEQARSAIEVAIARTLTREMQISFSVKYDGKLEITAFHTHGKPAVIPAEAINKKLFRHVRYQVELELQKRQALFEAEQLKQLRGVNVTGQISRILIDGTLVVTLEIADLFRCLILSGECQVPFQPPRERGLYRIGQVLEFYVTKVVAIAAGHWSARVHIRLSRTARDLPARLLRERTGINGISCRRRIAGAFSDIVSTARIPKEAIVAVGKELGEHLNVFVEQAV